MLITHSVVATSAKHYNYNLSSSILRLWRRRYSGKMSTGDSTESFRQLLGMPTTSTGAVVLKFRDDIAVIILDHPQKKNAMNGAMMLQLNDCISQLEVYEPPLRSVILTGVGNSFCAGADLDLVQSNLDQKFARSMSNFMTNALSRLKNLKCPSIALINGPAFGGGSELAVSCDLRLVTPASQIRFVHGRLGLCPAWGGGTHLVKLLGPSKALELLISGRIVGPSEAIVLGLANGQLKDGGVDEGVTWVKENVMGSVEVVECLKKVVNCYEGDTSSAQLKETEILTQLWGGVEHRRQLDKVIKTLGKKKISAKE